MKIHDFTFTRAFAQACLNSGENFPNLTAKKAKNDKSDKMKIFVKVPINTIPMVSPKHQIKEFYLYDP